MKIKKRKTGKFDITLDKPEMESLIECVKEYGFLCIAKAERAKTIETKMSHQANAEWANQLFMALNHFCYIEEGE